MGGSTVAEETIRFGIGVEVERLDLVDSRGDQAMNDIGFEVELRLAGVPCDEEAGVVRIVLKEACSERFVHFVGRLRNARPDRRMDILASRAEALHGRYRGIGDTRERPAPAGVRRADDDRVMIGEQHRRAIGGENPEQQVGRVGDHRVGAGALTLRPGVIGDDDIGRVDLVDGRKLGLGEKRGDREPAVAFDGLAVVIATEADVETRAGADRHAAAPPQKAVRELAEADRAGNLDAVQMSFRMMMSSSAWLPTMKS